MGLQGIDLSAQNPDMSMDPSVDKVATKFIDPCKQAAMQSMKCLERNGHDKTMCHNEFLIYRRCKQEFMRQRRERLNNA